MKTLVALFTALLIPAFAAAACPKGQKAVGDDSEQGYKCVTRGDEARPGLKPSVFKTGNATTATSGAQEAPAGAAGEAAKETQPVGAQERPLGGGLGSKKKAVNRGDAAPASAGCPKGWTKKGDGCAPPKKN